MADESPFEGTATRLRQQWANPSDIFTFLLIIGGDIVRVAIGQLSSGPVPYLTPVSFSFGWVTYAVLTMLSAEGENRLMPKPELQCTLINAESGYARPNHAWLLSRLLRDFDHWQHPDCKDAKDRKLQDLRKENDDKRADLERKLRDAVNDDDRHELRNQLQHLIPRSRIKVQTRLSVWQCLSATGRGSGDIVYWIGLAVSALQLGIAAIPWGIWGEWFTFLVTSAGTVLAYASGALPQWAEEKVLAGISNRLERSKRVFLTEGNGAHEILLILCEPGQLDLEALAGPQRDLRRPLLTRVLSGALATLWVALLITVSGWDQHTWFLVGVGVIGILHNVAVAGMKRQPRAWGIDLEYRQTFVGGKVMGVLWELENAYPDAGHALLAEFFPGELRRREEKLWEYAKIRSKAWKEAKRPVHDDGAAIAWNMPPLIRPERKADDGDIPSRGERYHSPTADSSPVTASDIGSAHLTHRRTKDAVIDIGG